MPPRKWWMRWAAWMWMSNTRCTTMTNGGISALIFSRGSSIWTATQAVGFARYRHPDAGKRPTPEDGDERRMYRQHVLLRAMVAKGKNFANVAQAPHLVDIAMSTIRTDLTRQQLVRPCRHLQGLQQEDIRTASLPGEDYQDDRGRMACTGSSQKSPMPTPTGWSRATKPPRAGSCRSSSKTARPRRAWPSTRSRSSNCRATRMSRTAAMPSLPKCI